MELNALLQHFFNVYGRRNRLFLGGMAARISFLNLAVGDLHEAVRKRHGAEVLGVAVARVASRIFCIAEYLRDLPLTETLARKFPTDRCSYCNSLPCACPERRPDYVLETHAKSEQLTWSLAQWSAHLRAMYGERNRAQGIENTINRIFKEVCEFSSLQMKLPHTDSSAQQIEEKLALEWADMLAWTIAIANLLEIDLECVVLARYGSGCWKCRLIPCRCTVFSFEQLDWSTALGRIKATPS